MCCRRVYREGGCAVSSPLLPATRASPQLFGGTFVNTSFRLVAPAAAGLCILAACALPSTSGVTPSAAADPAARALVRFFEDLHSGRYAEATELFGGSYEVLIDHNPLVEPSDQAALWRNACTINGAQCMRVRTATLQGSPSGSEFVFLVQFENDDGSVLEAGACCGGDPADFPAVSEFPYSVARTSDGRFLVQDLPVYLP